MTAITQEARLHKGRLFRQDLSVTGQFEPRPVVSSLLKRALDAINAAINVTQPLRDDFGCSDYGTGASVG